MTEPTPSGVSNGMFVYDPAPVKVAGLFRASLAPVDATIPKLPRSEEHTSELQSHSVLVCRLLLEKKKKKK